MTKSVDPISAPSRESLLARTLVDLADTLVTDFDVVDVMTLLTDRCVEVLGVAAAGLMLSAPDGSLRVITSSSNAMRVLELFELQADQGPCLDCFQTGEIVVNADMNMDDRWPRFSHEALEAGFVAASAIPMRWRGSIIGALNLFDRSVGPMSDADLLAAQAFADIATITVLHHRAVAEAQVVKEQLSAALQSRIVIEQAKGVLAERLGVDMDDAFTRLRGHARRTNTRLAELAEGVVDGRVSAAEFERADA